MIDRASVERAKLPMNQISNPVWWGPEHDFAWDHVKLSLQHALQTAGRAHSGGVHPAADTRAFPDFEPAYRFGFGARLEYGLEHPDWSRELEKRLREDWRLLAPHRRERWEEDRLAMCYGWNFAAFDMEEVLGC